MLFVDSDTTDDGVFVERTYYVQNWRHEVIGLVEPDGTLIEATDYLKYGGSVNLLTADLDNDGDVDGDDTTLFNAQ